jgi:hypothetical protein
MTNMGIGRNYRETIATRSIFAAWHCRDGRFRGLVCLAGFLALLALASPAGAQDAYPVMPLLDKGHEMEGIKTGFFSATGERVARLQIDRVGLEYRNQGFLRVALWPLVVLDGVILDVSDPATVWANQGAEILRTIRNLGGRNEVILRRVQIHVAGSPDVVALVAHVRADGALELSMPEASAGAVSVPATIRYFWLTGPQAGRLTQTVPSRQMAAVTPTSRK